MRWGGFDKVFLTRTFVSSSKKTPSIPIKLLQKKIKSFKREE
ncbi:hypothetical protein CAAU_2284 [Caloramator australicus RC3]|uniref:Uncharacterized protein n=1 Tax=Caloramator australicus RC3 TaxID=857293 RepID=I7LKE2_9CLOT|nr:hypothetical protein CAAU_2284 [Caloramator australicus RC3]